MRSDGCPAGSGRALRLDPFALPVRFAASDAKADGYLREVELHRTRVVVRRQLAGMRMALNLPVSAFAGVGLRFAPTRPGMPPSCSRTAIPRWRCRCSFPGNRKMPWPNGAAGAPCSACRCWSRTKTAGASRSRGWARCVRPGASAPAPPQRLKRRRPSLLMRRARGELSAATPVHRGEREIIARN